MKAMATLAEAAGSDIPKPITKMPVAS
jgi:hypothetical protein